MKKIKILFSPCHYSYDESAGGEVSWAYHLADGVASLYPESVVVTGFKKKLAKKKYQVIAVQSNKKKIDLSLKNAIIFNVKNFLATKKLLAKNKFDIVHHILPFAINNTFNLNFIFKRNKNLLVGPIQSPLAYQDLDINLADVRGRGKKNTSRKNIFDLFYFILRPILKFLSHLTLKKAKAIIVINEYTQKMLIKNGLNPDKIQIIPPGIDLKRFARTPFEAKNKEKIELLTVCYLIKRKGVDLIIRALTEVIKKNKKIVLRIVGDGPQKENLENLVKKLKLEDYVIFEGLVDHIRVQAYYKRAHLFISMSRAESWGQMYLEAMACGLPVISAKNIGSEAIIEDGIFGYLVEQEDIAGLAEKTIYLLENPAQINSFGERAYQKAKQKYDWQSCIIPQYLDIYQKLIK